MADEREETWRQSLSFQTCGAARGLAEEALKIDKLKFDHIDLARTDGIDHWDC